jgi:hypothetical protein
MKLSKDELDLLQSLLDNHITWTIFDPPVPLRDPAEVAKRNKTHESLKTKIKQETPTE